MSIGKATDKIRNQVGLLAGNWSFQLSFFLSKKNFILLAFIISDEA